VIRGQKAVRDRKGRKDPQVLKVRKDPWVPRVLKVRKDPWVLRDLSDRKAVQDRKVPKVRLDIPDRPGQQNQLFKENCKNPYSMRDKGIQKI